MVDSHLLRDNLETLDWFVFNYTGRHLFKWIDFAIITFVTFEIVSTIYNTIFQYKFYTFNYTLNPEMYSNPVFWHLNSGDHHLLDLLGLLIFFFVMLSYKIPPIISLMNLTFIIAIHESFWFVTYSLTHQNELNPIFTPVQLAYGAMIIFYLYVCFKGKSKTIKMSMPRPYIFITVMVISYMYWCAIGFPITVDFSGFTIYWMSGTINLLEITIWFLAIVSFNTDLVIRRANLES